jgi:hypothetical protein
MADRVICHREIFGRNTVKMPRASLPALSMLPIDELPLNAFVTKAGATFCNAALTYRWTGHRGPPHGDGHAPEGEKVRGLGLAWKPKGRVRSLETVDVGGGAIEPRRTDEKVSLK